MSEWIDVATVEALPVGTCKVVATDVGDIAVFNLDGQLYAIEDVCTHDGGELASGCVEGDEIICPRHGARFCIKNGKALTPPAYEDVECFPVRIEQGVVQVDIED